MTIHVLVAAHLDALKHALKYVLAVAQQIALVVAIMHVQNHVLMHVISIVKVHVKQIVPDRVVQIVPMVVQKIAQVIVLMDVLLLVVVMYAQQHAIVGVEVHAKAVNINARALVKRHVLQYAKVDVVTLVDLIAMDALVVVLVVHRHHIIQYKAWSW